MRGLTCALLLAITMSLPAASSEAAGEPATHRADGKTIVATDPAETGNIVIWVIDQEDVQSYFRQNRLMVGPVAKKARTEDGWELLMDYPSVNYVGDGPGSTTLYPHRITITASATANLQLDSLDLSDKFLVLKVVDAEAFRYELVGTAPYEQKAAMDWFADRQELLYRP